MLAENYRKRYLNRSQLEIYNISDATRNQKHITVGTTHLPPYGHVSLKIKKNKYDSEIEFEA